MIVVEGFDCSGKSTLAKWIGGWLSWPVVHTGGPTKSAGDVLTCLKRSRQRMMLRNVQDRTTHVSEAAYSMLSHPGKAALALSAFSEIPLQTVFVYCRPPTDFLLSAYDAHVAKPWDNKEHVDQVRANARQIVSIYDTLFELIAYQNTVIPYDRTRTEDLWHIQKFVKGNFSE